MKECIFCLEHGEQTDCPECVKANYKAGHKKLLKKCELLEQDIIELNSDIVRMNCSDGKGNLDSMAISTNAEAMRFLAERGMITIEKEYGRRVIGKWTSKP